VAECDFFAKAGLVSNATIPSADKTNFVLSDFVAASFSFQSRPSVRYLANDFAVHKKK
jgi:hypothetical protein